jgi:tetratricopeptide (TPR) repeat protein
MAAFDLDALLAADAQGAAREAKGAQTGRRLPELDGADLRGVSREFLNLLKRALRAVDAGEPLEAVRCAAKALDMSPEHAIANQTMGLALEHLGRLSQSIDFYERAWRFDPSNPGIYYNLGLVAWKLDMLEAAERFYRIALEMNPGSADATINLTCVLRDQSRFEEAIELIRAAIYGGPENPMFWNCLGTTLLDAGEPDQALTFYHETLRLDPEFARGWHNLSYAHAVLGDAHASIAASDRALQNPQSEGDRAEMLYGRAQALLAAGRVAEGWRDYATRLSPAYATGTAFLIRRPRWDADCSVAGKSILLVGEQGVGDEVLFLNAVGDLIEEVGPEGRVTVACEKRLISMVARSFPSVQVGAHGTMKHEGRTIRGAPFVENWDEIDLWTPMATPFARYRPTVESFPNDTAFLVADPERVAAMREALAALPEGPKIGLCWKSKVMNSKRSKFFSPFEDWKPVLKTPGVVFVNIQYGDVSEEIPHAAERHGATIHQIPGLDLMADLEGVAALGAALDLTMGPMNASTNLAAAVGTPTWIIGLPTDWPFLGTDRVPFYPHSQGFWPDQYGDWGCAMRKVAGRLGEYTAERQAA